MATVSIEQARSTHGSPLDDSQAELHEKLLQSYAPRGARAVRLRRPTREQGRALEILGHAVEYLIDTRMFYADHPDSRADGEAAWILTHASREVFEECAEIVSFPDRIRRWLHSHLLTSVDNEREESSHPSSALEL